ncbi:SIMPL domain-containing protein [Crocinitomix catalasitica]|uniref:SIMPL domain-containing protein n=1 Tax=Crocinitomix catalasitica TaxID=184607 RepID=UPI000489BDE4|nr:SIMPL domain-containing protein [Crocinitomix catalasitica]
MKTIKIILFVICLPSTLISQISGNQVYGNNSGYSNYNAPKIYQQKSSITSTATTVTLNVNLLLNKQADWYMLTIGTNQEATTVSACNKKINLRITEFIKGLKTFGIEKDNIYVDFISQTKIYDYEVGQSQAQQVETGYEIKKNIIIKLKDIDVIDQLIEMASQQEIYDIIKVEYIDEDVNKTYAELYKEAVSLIQERMKLYQEITNVQLAEGARILNDNFYSISPKTQYKNYQASESSSLNIHRQNSHYSQTYIQKESRKQKSFYYDGMPAAGFDRIINSNEPKVGLQYVFNLTLQYDVKE